MKKRYWLKYKNEDGELLHYKCSNWYWDIFDEEYEDTFDIDTVNYIKLITLQQFNNFVKYKKEWSDYNKKKYEERNGNN